MKKSIAVEWNELWWNFEEGIKFYLFCGDIYIYEKLTIHWHIFFFYNNWKKKKDQSSVSHMISFQKNIYNILYDQIWYDAGEMDHNIRIIIFVKFFLWLTTIPHRIESISADLELGVAGRNRSRSSNGWDNIHNMRYIVELYE